MPLAKSIREDVARHIIMRFRTPCRCAAEGRAFCSDRPTTPVAQAASEHNAPDWLHPLVRHLALVLPVESRTFDGREGKDELERSIEQILRWCRQGDPVERAGALMSLAQLSRTHIRGARAVLDHVARNS